jgi:hypothetical protein
MASQNERFVLVLHPNGMLDIKDRSTGKQLFSAGPFDSCRGPYKLVMMANGQLVLRDTSNRIAWASSSACRGTSTCYNYRLLDDGQLVVQDGTSATVWSSKTENGSLSAAAKGWAYQVTSDGMPDVSCIFSGPAPAAVKLVSQDRAYSLEVAQQGAALRLVSAAAGSVVWSPQGARSGSPPAHLCITAAGKLQLSGAGSSSLWASSYAVGPGAKGPFTALVAPGGALEVVDGACQLLFSSTASGKAVSATPPASGAPQARGNKTAAAGSSRGSPPAKRAVRGAARPPPPPHAAGKTPRSKLSKRPPPAAGSRPSRALSKPPGPTTAGSRPSRALSKPPGTKPPPLSSRQQRAGKQPPMSLAAVNSSSTGTGTSPITSTSNGNSTRGSGSKRCALQAGTLCGGVQLCGLDQGCPAKGCCAGTLGCHRDNEYAWRCF